MTGELGNFGGIPLFTDCAHPGEMVAIADPTELVRVMDERKDAPHTCGDKPCSRWRWENS